MFSLNRRAAGAIAATTAMLTLAACGGGASQNNSATDGGEGTTPVTLMLNWYPYGEHAPLYLGVKEGIFAKHGIDLTIDPGQGSTRTAQAVGGKQVDFGWSDTAAVLSNIDQGVDIKSVGVFLQTTPSAVQVFADSGIDEPADLAGRTIAVSAGDAPTTTFPMYLADVGLEPGAVQEQNLDSAGKMAALMAGRVDGLIGFAHDQGPTIANKSGREMRYFRYSDAGLNFYSNGLITHNSTIADNPELVQSMLDAVSESYESAKNDPEAAAKAMVGVDPQTPPEKVLLQQWQETIPLLNTPATTGKLPGTNAEQDWTSTIATLSDAGLLQSAKDPADYWASSFVPATAGQ
ncbi:NitT/TauT family transport system substrate-binding protein [Mycolicibacterium neoaurum]|uniref:ABC transporter substrate-binding protein n=1 Tax=Mycolicibacterium neoaurum TaxID=1795 RepID=UPI000561BD50|nr:ABC transporter substrate-binding protein [Mycolicibacterium neoaurum]SDE34951.1 NitT/TauT family transport system substrate-binding protein [Mycolicibacterium neoaurum]